MPNWTSGLSIRRVLAAMWAQRSVAWQEFLKSPLFATLHCKYTRALTVENLRQATYEEQTLKLAKSGPKKVHIHTGTHTHTHTHTHRLYMYVCMCMCMGVIYRCRP